MLEWDQDNLRKMLAQQIEREEIEQALLNNPIPVLEQDVEGDFSYVYYGETNAGRVLSLVVIESGGRARVITASDLNADQRRDYIQRGRMLFRDNVKSGAHVFVEPVNGALPGKVGRGLVIALGRRVAIKAMNGAGVDIAFVGNVCCL